MAALAAQAQDEIRLVLFAQGVTAPTDIQTANDGTGRMFFAEQDGKIRLYKNGALQAAPFLDISDKVFANGECGLAGVAFPPGYASKGYFYVLYADTSCRNRILARYRVTSNPDVADPASEQILINQVQTDPNHIGGQLRFGSDGYLYVSSGDGANVGDPAGNAQNKSSLLGKIWRIDTESNLTQYQIPPGNPYVGLSGTRPEVWALGFRNPWRFSFDRETGDMWIGDVGQSRTEEVNFMPAGASAWNFGWRTVEGSQCYPEGTASCDTAGMTPPVREYPHANGDSSVTGGFVYRGSRFPALRGTYVYGDFISGRIWGIVKNGSTFTNRLLIDTSFRLSTFGEDDQGELYVASYFSNDGNIYKIEGLVSVPPPPATPTIAAPTANQVVTVPGVTFQWGAVTGATGYDLRVVQGALTVFQGTLSGGSNVSTVVNLADGAYTFRVRACAGGFSDAQCSAFASVNFSVAQPAPPPAAPSIASPSANQVLTVPGVTFQWSSVTGATGYDARVVQGAVTVSQSTLSGVNNVSTLVTLADGAYTFRVRACAGGFSDAQCGAFASVNFSVALPPPPPGAPTITAPASNQVLLVSGVTFQWSQVTGATGYDTRVAQGASTIFQGTLSGANSVSTLVTLPDGAYTFRVRACSGGFADSQCGAFAAVNFSVAQPTPTTRPIITAPSNGQDFTTSTQTFSWTPVAGAGSYEILLTDVAAGGVPELSMAVAGSPPPTGTVFSMRGSTSYRLQVRACAPACGDWSDPVNFKVTLPAIPTQAPSAPGCSLAGLDASCSWNTVPGADFYTLQAVQPSSGPGGGALTVAGLRTTLTTGTVTLPPGAVSMFVAGCNGNGCGPYSAPSALNPAGTNPSLPLLGNPVGGSAIDGPDVFFSWNRVAGDNGSNTVYRLYVQDFSRQAPALDVLTKGNFWSAKFRGGGSRYDAVVVAGAAVGPAAPFLVRGNSPASPTMAQPRHQAQDVTLSVAAGNVQLGWTPVPGATLYEYLVSVQGQVLPAARGVTPGLIVQVPLPANSTFYSGIVRACPAGQTCSAGSDAGWGPWSSSPGQGGVTNFLAQ